MPDGEQSSDAVYIWQELPVSSSEAEKNKLSVNISLIPS